MPRSPLVEGPCLTSYLRLSDNPTREKKGSQIVPGGHSYKRQKDQAAEDINSEAARLLEEADT